MKHPLQPSRLNRLIQLGLLMLLTLMPFHAFLSVWLGSLVGHETIIEAWKEALLIVLAGLSLVLIWREPKRIKRLRMPWVIAAAAFVVIALVVTAVIHPPLTAAAYGAKTDLEFLLAAVIATLVADTQFVKQAVTIILATAGAVIGFGLLQAFILPTNFLTHFDYGPHTVAPFEYISHTTTPRFASTLGGPNQLGTYLILPLCLGLAFTIRRKQWWWLAYLTAGLIVLGATYSRGAWIGGLAALLITLVANLPNRWRRIAILGLGGTIVTAGLIAAGLITRSPKLQTYILHQSLDSAADPTTSDAQHASSLRTGLQTVAQGPLGHGLGTAGPATFHAGHLNIIEDNYLQIGYETGWLGLLAFLAFLILLLRAIWPQAPPIGIASTAGLIGVGLVALVLPAFTDSSTALITFTLASALASQRTKVDHVKAN